MMVKKYLKPIFFWALFILGILILSKSVNLAYREIANFMSDSGIGLNKDLYILFLEQCIKKNILIGLILSILGGFGGLINMNKK
jgi:hypothetical protein